MAETRGAVGAISPKEAAYLQSLSPTKQEDISASWRCEALQMLLWCLNKVPLTPLDQLAEIPRMLSVLPDPESPTETFLASAELRKDSERQAIYEEIYHAHWRAVDARIHGRSIRAALCVELADWL